tara:strand:+ start:153 stop:392 length:240 start_codon:yes stop_codon:yes gene_type:complete
MSEEQTLELTEQQSHLASLLQQRELLIGEIEKMKSVGSEKRDLLLKVLGAIEYLGQVGVTLPEPPAPEPEEEVEETPEE